MKANLINLCFYPIIGVILIVSSSCNAIKTSTATHIEQTDSLLSVQNLAWGVRIGYYSDYWFHSFTEKNTLNYNQVLEKQFKKLRSAQVLLYCGHTTSPPLCTTVGLMYTMPANRLMDIVIEDLRHNKANNINRDSIKLGENKGLVLKYTLIHNHLKIPVRFIEYFLVKDNRCFRIVFYTTDGNEKWLFSESRSIVERVVFSTIRKD